MEPRGLSLPSVWHWQIVLCLTLSFHPSLLSLPECFLCLGSVGRPAAIFLPLHHLLVAGDVSGIQQLVDRRVLSKEDRCHIRVTRHVKQGVIMCTNNFVDVNMHWVQNKASGLIRLTFLLRTRWCVISDPCYILCVKSKVDKTQPRLLDLVMYWGKLYDARLCLIRVGCELIRCETLWPSQFESVGLYIAGLRHRIFGS